MDRELADAARGETDETEKKQKTNTPPARLSNPIRQQPRPVLPHGRKSFDRNFAAIAAGSVMLAASIVLIALGPMGFGSRHVPPQPQGTVTMAAASVPVKTPAQTTLVATTAPSPMSECVTIEPDEGVVADCVKGTRTDLGEGRMKLCGCTLY